MAVQQAGGRGNYHLSAFPDHRKQREVIAAVQPEIYDLDNAGLLWLALVGIVRIMFLTRRRQGCGKALGALRFRQTVASAKGCETSA